MKQQPLLLQWWQQLCLQLQLPPWLRPLPDVQLPLLWLLQQLRSSWRAWPWQQKLQLLHDDPSSVAPLALRSPVVAEAAEDDPSSAALLALRPPVIAEAAVVAPTVGTAEAAEVDPCGSYVVHVEAYENLPVASGEPQHEAALMVSPQLVAQMAPDVWAYHFALVAPAPRSVELYLPLVSLPLQV